MGENAPPPDGWVCEPHAWNAERCCPPTCLTVATYTIGDNITLGSE